MCRPFRSILLILLASAAAIPAFGLVQPRARIASPCTDVCDAQHEADVLVCDANYLACIDAANGDPGQEAICVDVYVDCQGTAGTQHFLCTQACTTVPTEQRTWGQLKVLYR